MENNEFMRQLQVEIDAVGLSSIMRPHMDNLRQAIPHLIEKLKQLLESQETKPEFRELLETFLNNGCCDPPAIRSLMLNFYEIKDTGLDERRAIRFAQEINRVANWIFEVSDILNLIRTHSNYIEKIISSDTLKKMNKS